MQGESGHGSQWDWSQTYDWNLRQAPVAAGRKLLAALAWSVIVLFFSRQVSPVSNEYQSFSYSRDN